MNLTKTLLATTLALGAASVTAAPIVDDNVRPQSFGVPAPGEVDLQTVLDATFGAGVVNKLANQSATGLWSSAGGAAVSLTLMLEQTGPTGSQRFGIWFGSDTSNLFTRDLLLGPATPASGNNGATITLAGGSLSVTGSNCGTSVNCGTASDALIDPTRFGFYFRNDALTVPIGYSIDSMNSGGATRFMAYQGTGATASTWVFGFEERGTYIDFNDMVVRVGSIDAAAVPSPATPALLALGLLGIAAARRRRGA